MMGVPRGIMAIANRVTETSEAGFEAHPTKEKAPPALSVTDAPGTGLIHQVTPPPSRTYNTASKAAGLARPDTTPEMGVKPPAAGNAVIAMVTTPPVVGVGVGVGVELGVPGGEPPVNPGAYCAAATSTPE